LTENIQTTQTYLTIDSQSDTESSLTTNSNTTNLNTSNSNSESTIPTTPKTNNSIVSTSKPTLKVRSQTPKSSLSEEEEKEKKVILVFAIIVMIIVSLIGVCLVSSTVYLVIRNKSKTNDKFSNRGISQESIRITATINTVNSETSIAIRDTSLNS
jgi:hypothetical protein